MPDRGRGAAAQGGSALALAVLVRPGNALGFRLAGASVEEVAPGDEAAAVRRAVGDPHVGVVVVEEEVLRAAPPRLIARARQAAVPVLLPFVLPRHLGEAGRGRAYVAALVRRAVGYAVKLGGQGGGP
jgi:V/A-type H+-transporting ATPase subunit F